AVPDRSGVDAKPPCGARQGRENQGGHPECVGNRLWLAFQGLPTESADCRLSSVSAVRRVDGGVKPLAEEFWDGGKILVLQSFSSVPKFFRTRISRRAA